MKILVTGAAGFIGSHLAERLIDLGHSVQGVDCMTDYYPRRLKELNANELRKKGITILPLDLASDDLTKVARNAEVVYHLAAQPGISPLIPFETYARNNITATYRLLETLKNSSSLRAFINISTSSVYGRDATGSETSEPKPISDYGVTKLAAEQLVLSSQRNKGFPAFSMRLFSVYGPRERPDKLYVQLIRCILEDKEFPLFEESEHHLRSFTYVGDIVDGLIEALHRLDQCMGEIFNIGTDTAITTGEGIRIVENIIGKPVKIARKPKRAGDQLKTHANIGKARVVLDYNPVTTAKAGLEKEVEWYTQDIHNKLSL